MQVKAQGLVVVEFLSVVWLGYRKDIRPAKHPRHTFHKIPFWKKRKKSQENQLIEIHLETCQ